jgi:hypothetical protein
MNTAESAQKWGEGAKTSREGRFYSFQTVTEGGACLKRRGGASKACGGAKGNRFRCSAERDLRLCLKNPQVFEKT